MKECEAVAGISARQAALLLAIQAVLHTIGGGFGTPPPGAGAAACATMKSNHIAAMGLDRSYWTFFIGFGLCITVTMATEAAIFRRLSSMAPSMGSRLRPMPGVFTLGYIALTVLASQFFFPIPAARNVLIVAMLGGATIRLNPARRGAMAGA